MKQMLSVMVGVLMWSACAKAQESVATSGRFFAPIGGLVALSQPESEEMRSILVARLPDSKVAYDVGVRLLDPSIAAPGVIVQVKDQEVVLTGTVRSGAHADDVERAARQVAGVVSLKNLVGVK